jgi:hypothetical protein
LVFRTARLPDGCELSIAKNHITFPEKVNREFGKSDRKKCSRGNLGGAAGALGSYFGEYSGTREQRISNHPIRFWPAYAGPAAAGV